MSNANDVSTLSPMLGRGGFRLLAATEHNDELVLLVETTAERDWCGGCGARARSNVRSRVTVRDLPVGAGGAGVEGARVALPRAGVPGGHLAGTIVRGPPADGADRAGTPVGDPAGGPRRDVGGVGGVGG